MPIHKRVECQCPFINGQGKKFQSLTIYKWALCAVGDPANITQLCIKIMFENGHVKMPVYTWVKPVYKRGKCNWALTHTSASGS
jgi:hypothetical protein